MAFFAWMVHTMNDTVVSSLIGRGAEAACTSGYETKDASLFARWGFVREYTRWSEEDESETMHGKVAVDYYHRYK